MNFKSADDLIRLGRDLDGGYLISKSDLINSDVLIGLGVNDDWSFEENFINIKDIPLYAYDGSISSGFFFRQAIKGLTRIDNLKSHFFYWIKIYLKYKSFFRGNNKHIKKFVGFDYKDHFISMKKVLDSVKDKSIFLKIDIEGYEYRLLEDLLSAQEDITGLVIEFHDCDIHMNRIEQFIDKFSLKLVHIHANTASELTKNGNENPTVLEMTFSKYANLLDQALLPHPLDLPSHPNDKEFELYF